MVKNHICYQFGEVLSRRSQMNSISNTKTIMQGVFFWDKAILGSSFFMNCPFFTLRLVYCTVNFEDLFLPSSLDSHHSHIRQNCWAEGVWSMKWFHRIESFWKCSQTPVLYTTQYSFLIFPKLLLSWFGRKVRTGASIEVNSMTFKMCLCLNISRATRSLYSYKYTIVLVQSRRENWKSKDLTKQSVSIIVMERSFG